MENDLNQIVEMQTETDCFKVEHPNQDVSNFQSFQDWYRKTSKNLNKINKTNREISIIDFCRNCSCYCICKYPGSFCTLRCPKCDTTFCIGCHRKFDKYVSIYVNEETVCLKGFLRGLIIRIKYRRSELVGRPYFFDAIHIIVCLFFTPLLIGFLFCMLGFLVHPKGDTSPKSKLINNPFVLMFCLFRGILMFPYIFTFMPICALILLPSIFSCEYYTYVYTLYVTSLSPGNGKIDRINYDK